MQRVRHVFSLSYPILSYPILSYPPSRAKVYVHLRVCVNVHIREWIGECALLKKYTNIVNYIIRLETVKCE